MRKLKEVLAVVNNKGGVGKTTTVQNIAAAIVREHRGARVLIIDLDPQCHLSLLCCDRVEDIQGPGARTIYDALRTVSGMPVYRTKRPNVMLVPASKTLQDVDTDLFRQMSPKRVLQKCFGLPLDDHTGEGITNILDYDYVLIDCAPALSQTTYNAMTVATGVLIPVQMEGLSVNGVNNMIEAMRLVKAELNPELELRGLLPTMVDMRPRIARQFIDYLHSNYGDRVTRSMIRRNVKINEAQAYGTDIYTWRPYCAAGNDYTELCKELFSV